MSQLDDEVWKCFRCDLYFESRETASLHESLTHHKLRKVVRFKH